MNSTIEEALQQITVMDLIWVLILLATVCTILLSQKTKISNLFNKWRKNKNKEEEFTNLVYELKSSVESLKKEVQSNREERERNRANDREQSRQIREEMYGVIREQSNKLSDLVNTVNAMRDQDSKTKRAELKEKIERIYHECHPARTCTDMQLDTLRDLIARYEDHGGKNSFVHTTVEPEMYTWTVITRMRTPEEVAENKEIMTSSVTNSAKR